VRFLLIRPGALGDAILTLPVVQALDQHFSEASIDMMGAPAVLRLLCGRSAVRKVWSFDALDIGALFRPDAVLGQAVSDRLSGYDVIVNYAGPAQSVFAHNLSHVAMGRVMHCDARPGPRVTEHMSEFLQRPLRALGLPLYSDPPRLRLTSEDRQRALSWWAEQRLENDRAVALHPGSGSPAKNWPADQFAAVARHLVGTGNLVLLVIGPADDVPVGVVQREMQGMACTLVAGLPLPLLAAILERCTGFVGNDSGISHLAAAVGVPVVAIFGPTDPGIWAPRGRSVRVLRGSAAQAVPGGTLQHRLENVSVETVIRALQAVADLPGD
jgi:heptosyltransferase-3